MYSMGNTVNGLINLCCMGTDGSYAHGKLMYKLVTSLCCTPETNVTLCLSYTSLKKKKILLEYVL